MTISNDIINKSFLYLTDNYDYQISSYNSSASSLFELPMGSGVIDFKLFRSDSIEDFLDLLGKSIDKCRFELESLGISGNILKNIDVFVKGQKGNIFLIRYGVGLDLELNTELIELKFKFDEGIDYLTIRVLIK